MNYEQFKQQHGMQQAEIRLEPVPTAPFVLDEMAANAGFLVLVVAIALYLLKERKAAFFAVLVSIATSVAYMSRNW